MKRWICLLLCLLVLPFPALTEEGYTAFINGKTADRVHLRKNASADSESLGLFFTGTPVECFSAPDAEWIKVKIGAQTGYMMSKFVSTTDVSAFEMIGVPQGGASYLKAMHQPKTAENYSFSVNQNETVRVLGETKDNWYCVSRGADIGYIQSKYLSVQKINRLPVYTGAPTVALSSPYMPVLQKYYLALTEKWEWEKILDHDLSEMCDYHISEGNPLETVGYMLKDMNDDSVPELLIGSLVDGYTDKMLFAIYGIQGERAILIRKSWARARMYLCENQVINIEGSNSAFSSLSELTRLTKENGIEDIEITRFEGTHLEFEENGNKYPPESVYWFATEYIDEYPYGTMISAEEYDANISRYISLRTQYPLTAFSTLRGTVGRIHVNGAVDGKTTVNVRAGKSTSGSILASVRTGETVSVIAKNGDWYEVYYGGVHGFIMAKYVLVY